MPEWDVNAARSTVPLESYLQTLYERTLQSVSSTSTEKSGKEENEDAMELHQRDLFSLLPTMFDDVRETYLYLIAGMGSQEPGDVEEPPHPLFSGDDKKRLARRCPMLKYGGARGDTPQVTRMDNGSGTSYGSELSGSGWQGDGSNGLGMEEEFWAGMPLMDGAMV